MVDVNLKISVPAVEMLLKYAASGIGAVAGSMLGPWRARQAATVRRIGAEAEGESLKLIADAQADARQSLVEQDNAGSGILEIGPNGGITQRIEFQERKRQANIVSVVREAAAELGDKEVTDKEPDPDWTARFFDCVQDVSSEDMRKLWAKVLAGEVESPPITSLRTLSILSDMTQRHADIFSKLCRYGINNFVHEESLNLPDTLFPSSTLIEIEELGLMHNSLSIFLPITIGQDGALMMINCSYALVLEGEPGKEIKLHGYALTVLGRELAQFCSNEPDMEYLRNFSKFLAKNDCTLKIAPLIVTNPQGTPGCRRSELRIVEPAS